MFKWIENYRFGKQLDETRHWFHDNGNGVHTTVFNGLVTFSANGVSEISDKPVYLSLMMSREQVQLIVDNKNLFDESMILAAEKLLNQYDTLNVE